MCVCVCLCVCVCVSECVRACLHVCMWMWLVYMYGVCVCMSTLSWLRDGLGMLRPWVDGCLVRPIHLSTNMRQNPHDVPVHSASWKQIIVHLVKPSPDALTALCTFVVTGISPHNSEIFLMHAMLYFELN